MDTASMYEDFAKRYNKLYLTVKSLIEKAKERDERINELEQKVSNLESLPKKDDDNDFDRRIEQVETKSEKNSEKLIYLESKVKRRKKNSGSMFQ